MARRSSSWDRTPSSALMWRAAKTSSNPAPISALSMRRRGRTERSRRRASLSDGKVSFRNLETRCAPAHRRVRRAVRGNVEVAREKFRQFGRRYDARGIAAAAGATVDVLIVGMLDRVGAGQRLDGGGMLGKPCEQRREIVELGRDHMNHP